jgi:hypothetical protein
MAAGSAIVVLALICRRMPPIMLSHKAGGPIGRDRVVHLVVSWTPWTSRGYRVCAVPLAISGGKMGAEVRFGHCDSSGLGLVLIPVTDDLAKGAVGALRERRSGAGPVTITTVSAGGSVTEPGAR